MIYVLGSLNMDLAANVDHMPKKGETMTADKFLINCGGKGANQAIAVSKLAGFSNAVKMIGKVGSDAYGEVMLKNLAAYGVDNKFVTKAEGTSGLALIIVHEGDNRIILNRGANYLLTREDIDRGLCDAVKGDAILMQLEVPLDIVEYALEKAKEKEMLTILNPAPAVPLSPKLLSYVDIITPNETETEILTGIAQKSVVEQALAVKKFYSYGIKNVIITIGSRGAVCSHSQEITEIPPEKVKVVDTTSAGDTFVGAVAVMLQSGKNIVEACKFASLASSITITREGAASSIPTILEVKQKYNFD